LNNLLGSYSGKRKLISISHEENNIDFFSVRKESYHN